MASNPHERGRRSRTYRTALVLMAAATILLAAAGPAIAQTATDSLPVLYRMDKGGEYQQGCEQPCWFRHAHDRTSPGGGSYWVADASGAAAMLAASNGPVFTAGFVHRIAPRTLSLAMPARDSVSV